MPKPRKHSPKGLVQRHDCSNLEAEDLGADVRTRADSLCLQPGRTRPELPVGVVRDPSGQHRVLAPDQEELVARPEPPGPLDMHRQIAEVAGHHALAAAMSFMTTSAPELERLESERRAEARRES